MRNRKPIPDAWIAAVEMIALNDDPGASDALKVDVVATYVSTSIVAALFNVDPIVLARAIVKFRRKQRSQS